MCVVLAVPMPYYDTVIKEIDKQAEKQVGVNIVLVVGWGVSS